MLVTVYLDGEKVLVSLRLRSFFFFFFFLVVPKWDDLLISLYR